MALRLRKAMLTMKMSLSSPHPATHQWFHRAPAQRTSALMNKEERDSSPLIEKSPLAALGLALATSAVAGTAWTTLMLWWLHV